jgi:hypothetical protein
MKTIELQIKTSYEQVDLKMQDVSSKDHSTVIANVFQFLLRQDTRDVKEIKFSAPQINLTPQPGKIEPAFKGGLVKNPWKLLGSASGSEQKLMETFEQTEQRQSQKETKESRPRRLPIIDREHSEIVPVGLALQKALEKKSEVPSWWHTGIKVDGDGTRRYRCRYECPACGDKGKRYIPLGTKTIQCRKCEAELKVVTATGMWDATGIPCRDTWGNFFIANELAENEAEEEDGQE